jgi:phage/plasmid-like protein (TIGR03299 family)
MMQFENKTAWDGISKDLGGLATIQEVKQAVPDMFSPVKKEQMVRNGVPVKGKFWTVKESDDSVLGVVGGKYKVLQNEDAFRKADSLTADPNGPKWRTVGQINNGSTIFCLLDMPEVVEVAPGDLLKPQLLMAHSHDSSSSVNMALVMARLFCSNQLVGLFKNADRIKRVRHSGDILAKMDDAGQALGLIREDIMTMGEVFKRMAQVEPTPDQIDEVFARLIPESNDATSDNKRAKVLQVADAGMGNEPVAGTAWALYNGFTEVVDHHTNRNSKKEDAEDMRARTVLFGSGAKYKEKALDTIIEVCLK